MIKLLIYGLVITHLLAAQRVEEVKEDRLTKAYKMLKTDEGERRHPYDCGTGQPIKASVGHITIGIGRNLEAKPLSDEVIKMLLMEDIEEAENQARDVFPMFHEFSENRQLAIINMIFNMGIGTFSKFNTTINNINRGKWEAAAESALNSRWAKQVGERSRRVALMLKLDRFPYS